MSKRYAKEDVASLRYKIAMERHPGAWILLTKNEHEALLDGLGFALPPTNTPPTNEDR